MMLVFWFFHHLELEKEYGEDKRLGIFPASSSPQLLERINWKLTLLKLPESCI